MCAGVFDELLDLEETFHNAGYEKGLNDGAAAGVAEGRTFGLEQGFEKFMGSARLYGKSIIWANRNSPIQTNGTTEIGSEISAKRLPSLPEKTRLARNIKILHALVESESLAVDNSEISVSDFDDRLKRARAKAKVIEKLLGEEMEVSHGKTMHSPSSKSGTDVP